MVDKSHVDKELARRMCAAYVSHQMGVTVATNTKTHPTTWVIYGTFLPLWRRNW
jgi:hypothetical protein